jgi:hypothetical protein
MNGRNIFVLSAAAVLAVLAMPVAAPAAEGENDWLAQAPQPTEAKPAEAQPGPPPDQWDKPIPLSFEIGYTLVSDYVFRGINFSEYPDEGQEMPNHQMDVGVELDTADLGLNAGRVGVSFWFEWFAGQDQLTGDGGSLQEVDYTVYWSFDLDQIATTVELGYIAYDFPQASGDAACTHELYLLLSLDDSKLFGTERPVLNPYFYYGIDVDDGDLGSWMELGVSHDFAFGEMAGLEQTPVLKDLTFTPSFVMGIDHRYLHHFALLGDPAAEGPGTQIATLTYGGELAYDLGGALGMPERYGSVALSGFLYYNQALRDELISDEFWGGFQVAYAW